MSILSSLKQLVFPNAGMVCPRCEKALEGHDEAACERRMSRRYFFGVTLGAAAAVAAAPALVPALKEFVVTEVAESGIAIARRNEFLTVEMITYEMLTVLRNNSEVQKMVNRNYSDAFDQYASVRIGDTISIRKPEMFRKGDRFTISGITHPTEGY